MTAEERKQRPVFSGVLQYFPKALAEVAYCSWVGNEQHNPGQPLHWAKEKSPDHLDAMVRHAMDPAKFDSDGVRHRAKAAWRALAALEMELEHEQGKVEVASTHPLPAWLHTMGCECQQCARAGGY